MGNLASRKTGGVTSPRFLEALCAIYGTYYLR
jgi:hypothetical protein